MYIFKNVKFWLVVVLGILIILGIWLFFSLYFKQTLTNQTSQTQPTTKIATKPSSQTPPTTDSSGCGKEMFYPPGSNQKKLIHCGYVISDGEQTQASFLGIVESVSLVSSQAFVTLNLGLGTETVLLGNVDGSSKVSIVYSTDDQFSPWSTNSKPKQELLLLDKNFDQVFAQYIGKYVLFQAYTNSPEALDMWKSAVSKNTSNNSNPHVYTLAYLEKCGSHTSHLQTKYNTNNFTQTVTAGNPITNCHLYGRQFFIYE